MSCPPLIFIALQLKQPGPVDQRERWPRLGGAGLQREVNIVELEARAVHSFHRLRRHHQVGVALQNKVQIIINVCLIPTEKV